MSAEAAAELGEETRGGPRVVGRRLRLALLVLAVAGAFGDTSIVVIGLPEIYAAFLGATPFELSLVVVAYNIVVAATAFFLFPRLRSRQSDVWIVRAGLVVFAVTALGCGLAGSLWGLTLIRCAQGLGAGLLMISSLWLIARLTDTSARAISLWGAAGTFGAAVGPAFGGLLSELLGWEAIFFGLAVLAAGGLVAVLGRLPQERVEEQQETGGKPRSRALTLSEVLIYGALSATLFLAVVMVIMAWGLTPLEGAGVVTALPIGVLVGPPLATRIGAVMGALLGAVALALSLFVLAFLSAVSVPLAVVALLLSGLAIGLTVPFFTQEATADTRDRRGVAQAIGWRHLGLVIGLLVIGPITIFTLKDAATGAPAQAAGAVITAPVPFSEKVPFAVSVAKAFEQVNDGETPDVDAIESTLSPASQDAIADSVTDAVEPVFTRAFRWPFFAAGMLALFAVIPLGKLRREAQRSRQAGEETPRRSRIAAAGAIAVVLAGVGLLAYEFSAGAASFGEAGLAAACDNRPQSQAAASGPVGEVQIMLEDAIYDAACAIGESAPELIAKLSKIPPPDDAVQALKTALENRIGQLSGNVTADAKAKLQDLAQSDPVQLVTDTAKRIQDAVG